MAGQLPVKIAQFSFATNGDNAQVENGDPILVHSLIVSAEDGRMIFNATDNDGTLLWNQITAATGSTTTMNWPVVYDNGLTVSRVSVLGGSSPNLNVTIYYSQII